MSLTRDEVIKLYAASADEMHKFYESHNKRIEWFIGIISAIGAGTVAGLLNSTKPLHYLSVLVGAIAIVGVSRIARDAIYFAYRFFLEAISTRAKYEQLLGLTTPQDTTSGYWPDDTIVPKRYVEGRRRHANSDDWVRDRLDKDSNWWPTTLFRYAEGLGWLLCATAPLLAWMKQLQYI